MNIKSIIRPLVILAMLLLIVGLTHKIILGGAHEVRLSSAPTLTGQIAQVLGPKPDGSLPKAGQDYNFNVGYFDNGVWAVINLNSVKGGNNGVIVMKKVDGIYQAVVGPGTAIPATQLRGLPTDVAAYLSTHAAIYNPIPGQK